MGVHCDSLIPVPPFSLCVSYGGPRYSGKLYKGKGSFLFEGMTEINFHTILDFVLNSEVRVGVEYAIFRSKLRPYALIGVKDIILHMPETSCFDEIILERNKVIFFVLSYSRWE